MKRAIHHLMPVALVLVLAALACNVPISPAPAPVVPAAITEVAATTPPTEVAPPPAGATLVSVIPGPAPGAANAEYEGILFNFDSTLSSEWRAETVPSEDSSSGVPEAWLIPTHYLLTFPGYVVTGNIQTPRIMIFPTERWPGYNSFGEAEVARLRRFLQERPTQIPAQDTIPVLPIFNAAQVIRVGVKYLDFQNGTGVRFVTFYAQALMPVDNRSIFYTFQGITDDGRYNIAAFFPVNHPALPMDGMAGISDWTAFEANWQNYLMGTIALLDSTPDAGYTPDLARLDALIESLRITR